MSQAPNTMERINLTTKDGINISADLYSVPNSKKGVVLVHMMPSTKESWRTFAPKLQGRGWNVLAVDLRGHGGSQGGPDGFTRFTDAQHQQSVMDIDAAINFLTERGVTREEIVLIGASIGANLVLKYISENSGVSEAVLLSPGLDYRGIRAEPLAATLRSNQRVMLVGSNDDAQSDERVLSLIARAIPSHTQKRILLYHEAGHGTNMFGKESPDLEAEIINWIQ